MSMTQNTAKSCPNISSLLSYFGALHYSAERGKKISLHSSFPFVFLSDGHRTKKRHKRHTKTHKLVIEPFLEDLANVFTSLTDCKEENLFAHNSESNHRAKRCSQPHTLIRRVHVLGPNVRRRGERHLELYLSRKRREGIISVPRWKKNPSSPGCV